MGSATAGSFLPRLLRHAVVPLVGCLVLGYFAYFTVQGDRGLLTLNRLRNERAEVEALLARKAAERERLEHRVKLLHPEGLSQDLLDEQVRHVLNRTQADELVIPLSRQGGDPGF